MLRNIILALFGFIILALVATWIISGGPRRVYDAARSMSQNGISDGKFALPWQPENLFPTIEEDDLFGEQAKQIGGEAKLMDIENEYQKLARETDEATTFGNPSPFFGSVRIMPLDSYPQGGSDEHVRIRASSDNTAPVSLDGWSLQSAVSGTRAFLPLAASTFMMGTINAEHAVSLSPGNSAIIATAHSPLGVSFRENACTGYLEQLQPFSPPLTRECPAPANELPFTATNLQRYGESCFDFLRSLQSCEFPQNPPSEISADCRTLVQTRLSHNGCVDAHAHDADFLKSSWRIYFGANELWKNDHDAIRLLDAKGRIVDAYVY